MAENSLSDLIKADIKAVTEALIKDANRIRLAAMNPLKGDISRRVFQQGTATDGSPIGQYARSTKMFRNLVGRRIDKVDLQMTSTLRDSLIVGESEDRVVIGIASVNEPKIQASKRRRRGFATLQIKGTNVKATDTQKLSTQIENIQVSDLTTEENAINQEKHFGKSIFAPTNEEIEKSLKIFKREMDKTMRNALGGEKTIRVKRQPK